MSSTNTIINPKPCNYGCVTRIYWNTLENAFLKLSNSFELLQGSIIDIQKKYETLSDIVNEYNGKVHGSQIDRDPKTGLIDLLVYYEVPLGQREQVKRKFNDFVLSIMSRTN